MLAESELRGDLGMTDGMPNDASVEIEVGAKDVIELTPLVAKVGHLGTEVLGLERVLAGRGRRKAEPAFRTT